MCMIFMIVQWSITPDPYVEICDNRKQGADSDGESEEESEGEEIDGNSCQLVECGWGQIATEKTQKKWDNISSSLPCIKLL